ncbi:MAG TPA: sigma-70 family RNA polymerase sigma factor [Candidatus Dormibacteraeota bacterium]|nr:sigma-70 family RNA polymerase sigma factor [Candidatus Dormibacteraeota bacterium]
MPASDDLVLITAYLAGDAGSFDILFQRYHARVRAVCLRYVGEESQAEDLVQETFFRVIRALARVDQSFNFGAWVHRIAVNICQDELRRRSRRALHIDQRGGDPEEAMLKVADRDRSGHPEDALEMSSLRQLVWDVAKKLPERQRMVLTLRELQGLSYASIARFMGTTEAAVETLLHRARKRFKAEYLRLESPPEEGTSCAEMAFLVTRGRLGASEQREAVEHLETCALCRDAYQGSALSAAAGQAVVPA